MEEFADTIARRHTAEAMQALVDVMRQKTTVETTDDGDSFVVEGAPAAARVAAAKEVLARGYGMPTQAVISLPANPRAANRMASMSDADLLAAIGAARIAQRAMLPAIEAEAIDMSDPLCG